MPPHTECAGTLRDTPFSNGCVFFCKKDLVPLKLALKFLHRDQVTMMVELGLAGFLFISCLLRELSLTGKGQVEYGPPQLIQANIR